MLAYNQTELVLYYINIRFKTKKVKRDFIDILYMCHSIVVSSINKYHIIGK